MNIGDKYYSKVYKAYGTIIDINGQNVLIKWDKNGDIQSPPCWVDSKGKAIKPYK